MRSQKEKVIEHLMINNDKCICDDCLSELLKIEPRQVVNAICNKLKVNKTIERYKGKCSWCKKYKLVNCLNNLSTYFNNFSGLNSNNQIEIERFNRLTFKEFEKRVGLYLNKVYNQDFKEKPLVVGEGKLHRFDLVSSDNSIVVECKSYTWTKDNNFPSAKISTVIETVFYLSRIIADKKIIIFQDDFNNKGESLVDVFIRRYDGLLDDVEIWSYIVGYSLDSDQIKVKRKKGKVWYKTLHKLAEVT